ncbi:MAG: peptidoglycan D,D-transpeptidase FtsI family protein [Patescibacteria group bacterium]
MGTTQRRSSLLFTLFAIGFSLVIMRLFYWQIISGARLQKAAANQHFIQFTVPAARGEILDSKYAPIVVNQPAYVVYGEPRTITDVRDFSEKVAKILGLDPVKMATDLSDTSRVWVPFAHKVELPVVTELKALQLSGLGFEKEPKRFYPEASTAAHLTGFVGSDVNGSDKGYFGLEGYYDRQLRGIDGSRRLEKDAHGAPILISQEDRISPEDGRTLVLWMDKVVQQIVERRLKEGMERYGAKEGNIVVMDPSTGGILAMAAFPNYDARNFSAFDKSLYKNPIVGSSFEPGSTFKALIMASAIDENLVEPDTVMDEDAPVEVGPYKIRTWNNQYHGKITMTQVLEYSSNVGMVYVAKKLGKDKLIGAIKKYGFGKITRIDLEDEASPDLRADKEWGEVDQYTASFGQGIAVTPVQMVRAIAALANGGKLMEPHVVKEIREATGKTITIPPKTVQQVLKPETARIVTEMMVAAVDNGEAKWAKPKGYRVAGKTGTAQIPIAGHYDATKTIASFVGFAPADNPRFVMLVTLRETTSSPWGSETAAPLFFTIARDLFTYWGIPPQ